MDIDKDFEVIKKYFNIKRPNKLLDILYGYSIYNLSTKKIIARVYRVFNQTEWLKLDADTGSVLEYYREFYFETKDGIISIAYDSETWEPIEYYKNSQRRGFNERVKYDFLSNNEMTCDLYLNKKNIEKFVPVNIYKQIKELPFDIIYYSNKPYGNVVGFFEYNK